VTERIGGREETTAAAKIDQEEDVSDE